MNLFMLCSNISVLYCIGFYYQISCLFCFEALGTSKLFQGLGIGLAKVPGKKNTRHANFAQNLVEYTCARDTFFKKQTWHVKLHMTFLK